MDQTRPVSGFEGFPGTDPSRYSSGWGKCYQNTCLCFYFSFGSLASAATLSNWVLWLTNRLKCHESPDLMLQQKHQCCFPCLKSDFGLRCLATMPLSCSLNSCEALSSPCRHIPTWRSCCPTPRWNLWCESLGQCPLGPWGRRTRWGWGQGGLLGLLFPEGNNPGWWDYGGLCVRALPRLLPVWQPILRWCEVK